MKKFKVNTTQNQGVYWGSNNAMHTTFDRFSDSEDSLTPYPNQDAAWLVAKLISNYLKSSPLVEDTYSVLINRPEGYLPLITVMFNQPCDANQDELDLLAQGLWITISSIGEAQTGKFLFNLAPSGVHLAKPVNNDRWDKEQAEQVNQKLIWYFKSTKPEVDYQTQIISQDVGSGKIVYYVHAELIVDINVAGMESLLTHIYREITKFIYPEKEF